MTLQLITNLVSRHSKTSLETCFILLSTLKFVYNSTYLDNELGV